MGGSASNDELLSKVMEQHGIAEDIASRMHTDGRQTRFNCSLAWAKTNLKWMGAIENSARGVWSLTEKGERITEDGMNAALVQIRDEFRRSRRKKSVDQDIPDDRNSVEPESSDVWKDLLLSVLHGMEPAGFERLAQRLLREAGFVKVEVTGKSGDGGIDGTGVLRVNLLSFQVLFQCKRYRDAVRAPEIRNFRGAMISRSDKGLILTTGTFTSGARKEATRDGAPPIELMMAINFAIC
jgi:restriction system protein